MSEARFFRDRQEWHDWLAANHATAEEQWVGFHKSWSDKAGITYRDALDEALCFGWIDGLHRGGHAAWSIRFAPRRLDSVWSAVNMARIEELIAEGRVEPAGLAAYQSRNPENQRAYSYENPNAALSPDYEARFRADPVAWAWFEAMPLSYRRPAIWWVMSARQEATRERRLAVLIAESAAGHKIESLRRPDDD